MSLHEPGDVVRLPFPYEEDSTKLKPRPALILRVEGKLRLALLKITGTNKSDTNQGMWVKKDSERGMLMGLTKDSFIDCSRIVEAFEYEVLETIGYMDESGFEQIEFMVAGNS